MASCSVRFALVFHFCWFWKNRVEFVSSRAVVVIIPYTFQAVSCSVRNRLCFFYVGCGKLVSNSYPVVRCSCFFSYPFDATSCSKPYPAFVSFDVRSGNLVSSSYALVRCFHVQFVSRLCIIYVGSEKFVAKSYPVVCIRVYFVLFTCVFENVFEYSSYSACV